MKTNANKLLILFVAIIVGLGVWKITDHFADKRLEKQKTELRKLKIRKDTLQKERDGYYTKLVADTLTKKELRKEIEDLKIKVKDGVIVEKIVLKPIEVEKEIDSTYISKDKDTIVIKDHYPNKEEPFMTYEANIIVSDSTHKGKFTPNRLPINIVVEQLEDGTYKSHLQAPEFIEVESLDIQSLPLTPPKVDNFGWLAGGKLNHNMTNGGLGYEFMGGLRYKKLNIIISANTNKELGAGLLFEF